MFGKDCIVQLFSALKKIYVPEILYKSLINQVVYGIIKQKIVKEFYAMNRPYITCFMMTSVDGRSTFPSVFNRNEDKELTLLKLIDVKAYDSGAVCIRYKTEV